MQDLSRLSDDELRALYAQSNGAPVPPAPPAPQPTAPIIVRRADPGPEIRAQNADARADAQLALAQAAAARAAAAAERGAAPTGYRFTPSGELERIPGAPAPAGTGEVTGTQRDANLRALAIRLADVRRLYEANFRGGWPNGIVGRVPDMLRPENVQFESAGAGMADIGNAAFRIPGMGAQSDADAARFVAANTPLPTDSDLQIEEKLHNLEVRLNETYRAMGMTPPASPAGPMRNDTAIPAAGGQPPVGPVDPLGMGGPAVLPQARGAQADAGIGAAGVADAAGGDGMRVVPELYGLGGEISALIQRGATREQVLAHYQARMERAASPRHLHRCR